MTDGFVSFSYVGDVIRFRLGAVELHRRLETGTRAYGVAWVATAVVFLGLDAVWLSFERFASLRRLLGDLLRARGAVLFDLHNRRRRFRSLACFCHGSWSAAGLRGLALRLFGYSVYDLTNQVTLRIGRRR